MSLFKFLVFSFVIIIFILSTILFVPSIHITKNILGIFRQLASLVLAFLNDFKLLILLFLWFLLFTYVDRCSNFVHELIKRTLLTRWSFNLCLLIVKIILIVFLFVFIITHLKIFSSLLFISLLIYLPQVIVVWLRITWHSSIWMIIRI